MKNKDIKRHKGELLNQVVRKNGITITALAKKVGINRSTVYNHINDPILPYRNIVKYGAVLNHDFSWAYPPSITGKEKEEPLVTTFEEMERNRDFWKSKYFALKGKLMQMAKEED